MIACIERAAPSRGRNESVAFHVARRAVALFALAACCATASAQKLAPSPTLVRLVNDNVAMLSEEQDTALETRLAAYRVDSGTRIVLLTIASTAPESIEQYAARVARDWSAAHRGDDNAFFVIVARDNRPDSNRVRIEAGRGVPKPLAETDVQRIVAEDVLPRFQVLDYNGGLVAGIERVQSLLAGVPFPAPPAAPPPPPKQDDDRSAAVAAGAAALFGFLLVLLPILRVKSRRLVHLTGHRAQNRSFEPMIVGRFVGRPPKVAPADGGNGFGGGFGVAGGYAGGRGDFSGGGSSGFW